jgi:hypothetical protein
MLLVAAGLLLSFGLTTAQPQSPQPFSQAKSLGNGVIAISPLPANPVFSAGGFPYEFDLPAEAVDESVPTPAQVIGHRPGESLTSPEEIVAYARAVALKSRRVKLETYGTTPEGRPLSLLYISSSANIARLEELRQSLRLIASGSPSAEAARKLTESMPGIVWIACSVHGDEPAGGEAGLALLYWLTASRQESVKALLERLVVILDPDANPDGRARHVSWWRATTTPVPDEDPDGVENSPAWPDGRTNHNLFDLNRDWAWATQPETEARIKAFRATPPQVYVDLHEMNPEASYFFPPDAEPIHPNLGPEIKKWLDTFGKANARAFDQRGWSYFVRESFDRFYPGYGDSWPSFHGAVGMTFEVGGSGGAAYRRRDGSLLTLKERVVKHFTAARTTLETAAAHREDLQQDFATFFRRAVREGKKAFVVPAGQDPARLRRLARLLAIQGIAVEQTSGAVRNFPKAGQILPEGSLVIDTAQPLGRFAETLLEPTAKLSDDFIREERRRLLQEEPDHFFDVTAWSLPIAFGLESFSTSEKERLSPKKSWQELKPDTAASELPTYGWVIPAGDSAGLKAAGILLSQGVRVSVTTLEAKLADRRFGPGSFLIRRENNDLAIAGFVAKAAQMSEAEFVPLSGAWTDAGVAFGSRSVVPLKSPKVVVLGGEDVSSYGYGAVLFTLRERLGIRPLRRSPQSLGSGDLAGVRVIIIPHGTGVFERELLREEIGQRLHRFVEEGGVLIGIRNGAEILREKPISLSEVKPWEPKREPEPGEETSGTKPAKAEAKPSPAPESSDPVMAALEKHLPQRTLALPGAALKTEGLLSHPLLYGLVSPPPFLVSDGKPPLPLAQPLANVLKVTAKDPLASGFAWKEALEPWTGAPLVQVEEVGRGKVISFAADPVFRGIWAGPEIVFLNAVLFAGAL